MGQGEILEELYSHNNISSSDLSVFLDLEIQSVRNCLKRLIKHKYVVRSKDFKYRLTEKGKDFVTGFYL